MTAPYPRHVNQRKGNPRPPLLNSFLQEGSLAARHVNRPPLLNSILQEGSLPLPLALV